MDKKEKALRFGISLLQSVNYLLTVFVVCSLLVVGLIYYSNWKYDREQEANPPETRRTRKDMTSSPGFQISSMP